MSLTRHVTFSAALLLILASFGMSMCTLDGGLGRPGQKLNEVDLSSWIGGECQDEGCSDSNCIVNQNPNVNPCTVDVQACSPSKTNDSKCISVSMANKTSPRCLGKTSKGNYCTEQSQGYGCAITKVGDKVDNSCTNQCKVESSKCGSSVYTCTPKQCNPG